MAGSALATSAAWQSAAAHHPVGMPRDRSPPETSSGPIPMLRLLCIFLGLLSQAHSSPTALPSVSTNQLYIVCKNLDSNTCVTWLLDVDYDRELSNELTPFNRPSQICGLSDLKPIPPHRKFITVTPFEGTEHSKVFCKSVNVVAEDLFHLTDYTDPFTSLYRERRQTGYGIRGRYRGQTQSQYLAIDRGNGKDEGKAEAHSAADSSRASVSGNNGMGQAQSQTIYDPSCDDCYGSRNDMEASNLRRPEQNIYGYGHGAPGQGESVPGMRGQGGFGRQGIPDHGGNGVYRPPGQGIRQQGGQGGIGGQGIPGQGGISGQGIPGQGGISGQGIPGQGGISGQGIPGQGGISGQGIPGQGGISGQGIPGQGGISGQGIPGQGGISGQVIPGQGGISGQGIPGQGGISGQGIPGQGGISGQGIPGQGGISGQGIPGQGGISGQGIPGRGGISGQGIPGQGGISGQGIPGQGGISGQGMPGQGGISGQGIPGQGGISGQGIPGQGGISGQGIPGQGGISGQGIPGQGGISGQGIPGQGGISGQGIPGQGRISGQGIPGQGGNSGQGIPGQGGISGQRIPGQGGISGQGIPGQGGISGQGIPGQGGISGQGIPGQGGINGQGIPGQGAISGQGIPGQGGISGQGIPGQGGISGQGIPGQGGISGQGIPGQVGISGQGIPGQGGISGQGIPGQGGISGQGIPGQGGISSQGIPGQGGISGQGIPRQGGISGQGIPGQGGISGQGIPGQGGISGQGTPGQGGISGQGIPGQGGITGQGIPGQGEIGSQGIPIQSGNGGQNSQAGMPGGFPSYDTSIVPSVKWPLATGPIRGTDGLIYYCCVVNSNQEYYPNKASSSNIGGNQPTSSGKYGQTGVSQITGGNGQPPYYGNGGNLNPSYTYGLGGTEQMSTGQQPNYGNGQPGPSYNYAPSRVPPDQFGPTGGIPSSASTLQPNIYGNGENVHQGHPYTYGPGVDSQSNQNRPYGQSGGSANNGQQGPTYSYGSGGNGQTSPRLTYGNSQAPSTGTGQQTVYGQGGKYGPDYTYDTGVTGQPGSPGIYGQSGGSQIPYGSGGVNQQDLISGVPQTTYSQGGNGQQFPGYNYGSGGSGLPNLSRTYGQTGGGPQIYGGLGSQPQYGAGVNAQQSPNYTYGGTGQPNVGGIYSQDSRPTVSGSPNQPNTYEQNGQQSPGYTYGQGGASQPTPGGTYGQAGVGTETTYGQGVNGQQGPDSSYRPGGFNPSDTYGQPGGVTQATGDTGTQNGGHIQQGNGYNQNHGGNGKGQQTVVGYGQGSGQRTDYSGEPQNVMEPNSIIEENDDSQALASVYQGLNGTTASASSQGGNEKGHAQTNVEGTYTDTGSFSAQASISDENKGAESQVSGSKKGATSNAEGRGRKNKSQAAVKLGSETGSIQTESQSGGNMHSSNTQVQGSVKGGVADAQARGPGSTSSQAQIGFTPYKEGDKTHEIMKAPFEGGGTASAQSSGRMGTSQSQLRGTFKYGITYNGAAQAGASLDKDANFSNFTPFDKIDVFDQKNTNINVNIENTDKPLSIDLPPDMSTSYEGLEKNEENTIQDSNMSYNGHSHYDHHKPNDEVNTTSILPSPSNRRAFSSSYDNNNNNNGGDYDYNVDDTPTDEYDVEEVPEGVDNTPNEYTNYDNYGRETENTHQPQRQLSSSRQGLEVRQTTGGNTQHILIGSLKNQDAKITQIKSERPDESKVYQPGERVPGMGGYIIPDGFTGSVKSVSSKEKTYVVGTKHSPSQAQTVTLTPGSGKVKYTNPEHYGKNTINPKDLRSLHNPRADDNRYVSVSKSVTRDLDSENNVRKQYSHTYFTKSSSCGYFTFTCTMVSSAEGKKKVCRPKIPTNPDGTPMRC